MGKTPHFGPPLFLLSSWHEATAISLLRAGDRNPAAQSEPRRNTDPLDWMRRLHDWNPALPREAGQKAFQPKMEATMPACTRRPV